MYILKNACKNLARNRKRYFLQGGIVLLLLVGVCISIVVGDTLRVIIDDYEKRFQINASLEIDYMSLFQSGRLGNYQDLSERELEKIAKSKHVKQIYLTLDMGVYLKDIRAVSEGEIDENLPEGMKEESIYFGGEPANICNASLNGYDDLSQLSDFINGTRKIQEGRFYENVNECIISSELAEKNQLSVGDTIKVLGGKQDVEIPLKIVGIYLDAKPLDQMHASDPNTNYRNEILVNCDTIKSNFEDKYYGAYATYVMKSADDVDAFKRELKEQGILDTYKLNSNKADFDKMVKPVQKLGSMMKTFQLIIIVCGMIVLLILSVLSVQERTYEIGVLRCRGMKKWKLAAQFILENLIMVGICLFIGLSVSSLVSEPLSNKMLKEQISLLEEQQAAQQEDSNPMSVMASFIDNNLTSAYGDNSDIVPLEKIKIQMSLMLICKIVGIAFVLALLASMASVFAIMRYEPSKILANRN